VSAPQEGCHRIFLASAGTGKTYRLSGRFLDLLLAHAEPRSILATTFTRKAAGEILDRVLERLVETVDSAQARDELAELRDFGSSFEAADALNLLSNLMRGLDRFEVRTLDSFFIHLGRLFALDLDLAPQWSVAQGPEADEVTADALALLLEGVQEVGEEAQFAEILREITASKGAGRSVHKALTELVKRGRSIFLDSSAGAWNCVNPPAALDAETLAEAKGSVEALPVPVNKGDKQENRHWADARTDILSALEAEDWKKLSEVGLVKKVRDGEDSYSRRGIGAEWVQVIETLLRQVAHDLLSTLVIRNARAVELLTRYEDHLQRVKHDRGLYDFADIPRALAPSTPDGPGPIASRDLELAYRLDATINHLLLDEFQDTAPVQWRVLAELAENICSDSSGEQSFFCVGDVKQSIYGWRSAEPRLLATLGRHLQVKPEPLKKNFRSSTVILSTVNQVFESLSSLPVFDKKGKESHLRAAQRFEEPFEPHEAAKNLPGAAELRQARPSRGDEKRWMPVIELAIERVVALAKECPQASIGVLLRANKAIPRLIARLQMEGLPVSGEGGNPLTDSAAVLHFISLLHLADHPSDTMAAFHLSSSPLPAALGCTDPMGDRLALSRLVRERLSQGGLGQLCADLEHCVGEHAAYSEWDRRRYRQLGDSAFAWSGRSGLRADRFVDLVRAHRVEVPAAARIKVMTVHASKGLEFDVVILPELDEPLAQNRWNYLVRRDEPRGLLTMASINPSKDVAALDESLRKLYADQSMREAEEALCVLYVGMTRARYRLEMLVRDRNGKDGGSSPAGILRTSLGTDAADGNVLWRHRESADAWFPAITDEPVSARVATRAPLVLAPTTTPRRLPGRSPSSEEGGPALSGASLLASSTSVGTRFGLVVHRYLQEHSWPAAADLEEGSLLPLAISIEPDETVRREAFTYLQQALQNPDIRAALSEPDENKNGDEWEVWREREFCVVLTDERGPATWRGSFDRVLLRRENGEFVSAIIQDYKTDRVDADSLEERVAYYSPQLLAYRRALSSMTGLAPEAIGAQLLFLGAGMVREIGP
jgi:ATP-dependent exoDNAse (exonuclease V) beta subunit